MTKAKIIAIANHKGGVGKTTTAANLGAILALKGYKVLLIDLDAQANLTASVIKEQPEGAGDIYRALTAREALPIIPVNKNLSIVPSSLDLAGAEIELAGEISRENILKDCLGAEADKYDYIILDCSPSLGLLTINAFTAADSVIIPTTAEALPTQGLQKIIQLIDMVKARINPALRLSGILITRWRRRNLSTIIEEQLRERYGDKVYKTIIRENVALAEAPLFAQNVREYAPGSNGAKDYETAAEEILEREQNRDNNI